jgi:ribosomal-protein-alanine N-acetyltransferase
MAFAIRTAVPADLNRVLQIARECHDAAQWPDHEFERSFAPESGSPRVILVISDDHNVHGFIIGRAAGDQWEIENVAIDPGKQRQGLGAELVREFLNRTGTGANEVFLEVRESNLPARKLYEKLGFAQVGRRKSYYQAPAEDAILLRFSF